MIWVLVYFWTLPSDSGPKLSGNGGEGRGGTWRADCGVISDPGVISFPVTDNCGGSCLPLLCFPEPKVLAGPRGPGVPTRKGEGIRKPSRTLRKGAFCPGAFCDLAAQGLLLTSGMPSGARQ